MDEVPATPVGPEPAPPRRARLRPWLVGLAAMVAVLGAAGVAGAVVRLPYVLISPGDATSVGGVIEIEGARTYRHDGDVLFLTVSVSSARPNAYAVLQGWLDDDVQVISEDEYLGGRSRRQEEELNRVAMDCSQLDAKRVSLERLGYPVPVTGFIVGDVAPDSPADGKLEVGDTITAVDGTPIRAVGDLGQTVRARPAGDPVIFTVERGSNLEETVTVETRAAPSGPFEGQAQVGVATCIESEFPVHVQIETGKVGGPSAGLAFTLTILDELSPGDLTGGRRVAVTGTIDLSGTVGPIGGIEQKAVTARRAGATLFLVPEAEARAARAHAGDMRVVGVSDLVGALAALEDAGGDPLAAGPPTVAPDA